MRIWLLLAGEYADPLWQIAEEDIVIAVDGGIVHAQRLGVCPDVWLGDFDSSPKALTAQYRNIPRERYPIDKDATDFELALDYVAAHHGNTAHISIIGGQGGEPDHAFANLWVLAGSATSAVLWGAAQHIVYLSGDRVSAQGTAGDKVSIFALTPLSELHYSGLKWSAPKQLLPFSALASRNILTDTAITVGWQHGRGLVFLPASITHCQIMPSSSDNNTATS